MTQRNPALGLALLSAFLVWQAFSLKHYIQAEKRPPAWDQAVHMEIALDYRHAIHEGRWGDALRLPPKPGMPPFPPLYHLALMSAYDLDPSNPAGAALWLNEVYLALLCFSIFGLCWNIELGERAWMAAVAFACAPAVLDLCRTQLSDLAVVAWVAAAYWAYACSKQFSRWPGSIAFGFVYGVGMMHKWSFFSYLLPVYWEALVALFSRETRRQTLAAAGIAALGFGPWYWVHLPILLPRLAQASADFAVPVWQGDAFLQYFYQMPSQLGPALFLLGCVGLIVPVAVPYQRARRLAYAWFLLSYIFWAVVPNRQIRFLLPGLTGFSILACLPWHGPVLWVLMLFQVFTAANYSAAWIPAFATGPGKHILFFPSNPTSGESWPLQEILRRAQALHPREAPLSNLTLVANDAHLNGPTLTWMAKWLGLEGIRMRGVNSRLCEFSRFVLLKTGSLGPPGVIEGLPEAARIIQDPHSWFSRAYEEDKRWPLPDHSEAVLYKLRPLKRPPFRVGASWLDECRIQSFSARNLKIALGDWDARGSAYRSVSVAADKAQLRGLSFSRVALEMEGMEIVPVTPAMSGRIEGDVRFLQMRVLRVKSAEISSESLRDFVQAYVPGLAVKRLEINGRLSLAGEYRFLPLELEVSLREDAAPRRLAFGLTRAKIGPLRVPAGLLGYFRERFIPLDPNPETPFRIELAGLTLKNGRVTVP